MTSLFAPRLPRRRHKEMGRLPDDDPLTLAMAPPPGETEDERVARLKTEEAARAMSERIDEELREEKAALKKKKKPIKVLLLGQSESGTFPISSR